MRKLTESPLTALGPDALGKALGRHSSSKSVVFSKNKTEKQVKLVILGFQEVQKRTQFSAVPKKSHPFSRKINYA
jgi:hypothetical protein